MKTNKLERIKNFCKKNAGVMIGTTLSASMLIGIGMLTKKSIKINKIDYNTVNNMPDVSYDLWCMIGTEVSDEMKEDLEDIVMGYGKTIYFEDLLN